MPFDRRPPKAQSRRLAWSEGDAQKARSKHIRRTDARNFKIGFHPSLLSRCRLKACCHGKQKNNNWPSKTGRLGGFTPSVQNVRVAENKGTAYIKYCWEATDRDRCFFRDRFLNQNWPSKSQQRLTREKTEGIIESASSNKREANGVQSRI